MGAPNTADLRFLEEVWEVDVGGCVEVSADFVASVGHSKLFEEMGALVFAGTTVFGVRIEVERIIACLCEFSIADDLPTEMRIHGVEQSIPVVAALNLPPDLAKRPLIIF